MTTTGNPQSIVVEYTLKQPPEKVWRVLTEPKLLARWLMENDIAPVVGHRFTMRAQPMGGWDGTVHCEVLACEAPRLLRYSWQGGVDTNDGYGSRLDTQVTWTLAPAAGGGTLLRLEHAGFLEKNRFAFQAMGQGWRGKVGERIEEILAAVEG